MANLTCEVTLQAADQTEYDAIEVKVDAYVPRDGEPAISNITKDPGSLTFTFTLARTG